MGGYLNIGQTFWILWFYFLSTSVCSNSALGTKDQIRLDMKHNSNVSCAICYMLHIRKKIYKQIFKETHYLPNQITAKGISLMGESHTVPLGKGNWDISDAKWFATYMNFCALI